MVTCTSAVTVYVPLLHEGTHVLRPTEGLPVGKTRYKLLQTPGYSPELEEWEFPPGSVVECAIEKRDNREVLVARSKLS
jgi:hypothetical protein